MIAVWGPERVGYKLSPHFAGYSMSDSNPVETFSYIVQELNQRKVGYIHIGEAIAGPMAAPAGTVRVTPILREHLQRHRDRERRLRRPLRAMRRSRAAKPTWSRSACHSSPIRTCRRATGTTARSTLPDQATFYAGEEKGYIDYPALA